MDGFGNGTVNFASGANVTSGIGTISFNQFNLGAGGVGTTTALNPTNANVIIGTVDERVFQTASMTDANGQQTVDTFDQLFEDGGKAPRVMAISMHPYLSGAPHRTAYVRKLYDYLGSREGVIFCTGEQILDWYLKKTKTKPRKKK